jgi:hypothetical protein
MADEQPNTLSAEPQQTPDAQSSEPSSDELEKQSSESPSWWRRMFNRRGGGEEETEASSADKAKDAESSKPALSQEELDRRVQAEVDRREYRRAQEAKARARKELRDSDPWQYAEQERQEEQLGQTNEQLVQFFSNVGTEHDRYAIDPVVELVPQADRERIMKMENAGRGLEGRKLVVKESLKALEKHWKAEGAKDAERKLRSNPAFRKQVLSEIRGSTVEPDLLPSYGSSPSTADQTVSALLRQHYDLPAPREHNELNGR